MARERTKLLAIRVSAALLREIDAFGERLSERFPWLPTRRADFVRMLIAKSAEGGDVPAIDGNSNGGSGGRHDQLVSVRIPEALLAKLEEMTRALGPSVSRSDVVRALIVRALAADREAVQGEGGTA